MTSLHRLIVYNIFPVLTSKIFFPSWRQTSFTWRANDWRANVQTGKRPTGQRLFRDGQTSRGAIVSLPHYRRNACAVSSLKFDWVRVSTDNSHPQTLKTNENTDLHTSCILKDHFHFPDRQRENFDQFDHFDVRCESQLRVNFGRGSMNGNTDAMSKEPENDIKVRNRL